MSLGIYFMEGVDNWIKRLAGDAHMLSISETPHVSTLQLASWLG